MEQCPLTRRMELTDSVMCRRLISVSSLCGSQQSGELRARPPPLGLPPDPARLRLFLMLLPSLGLGDAVVTLPVQDLLQLLLLPGGASSRLEGSAVAGAWRQACAFSHAARVHPHQHTHLSFTSFSLLNCVVWASSTVSRSRCCACAHGGKA